jgi:DNA polymerase-1
MTPLPSLAGHRRISLDLETNDVDLKRLGPGPRRGSYIVGIALAYGDQSAYWPVAHLGGGNVENPEQVKAWARQELSNYTGEVCGANILYDMLFLSECWGVEWHPKARFADVLLAATLLDEHGIHSFETVARHTLGVGKQEAGLIAAAERHGWKSGEIKQNLWRLSGDEVRAYAEADASLPLEILHRQEEQLAAEGLSDVFDLETRCVPVTLAMQRGGVRIDLGRAETVRRELVKRRDQRLAQIRAMAGDGVRLMAPESFAEALASRGCVVPRTATGKPNIDKPFLDRYRGDPLVDSLAEGRRIDTLLSQLTGHVECAVGDRIYSSYHQLRSEGVGSIARFSSSKPNQQNVAGRGSDRDEAIGCPESPAAMVRGIYIPEEEQDWWRLDYSQIEYRLLVDCAVGPGAEAARQRYRDDPATDFHVMTAQLAGMAAAERAQVKQVNFATIYGGGNGRLAELMGVSVEEAEQFRKRYSRALPFVASTFQKAKDSAQRFGLVLTVLKRRMRFDQWEPRVGRGAKPLPRDKALEAYGLNIRRSFCYAGLNRKLQGSAADVMKAALVQCWEAGVFAALGPPVGCVHDEIDVSAPKSKEGREAVRELRRIMCGCVPLSVPLAVDVERGPDWGHLERVE